MWRLAMVDCLFCRIVDDRTGSQVVWEDELTLGILDINPVTDGHSLIIPKEHCDGLDGIAVNTAARMMNVAQELGAALKRANLRCDGLNLFFADGEAAFQTVFHSHLHVFPRYEGDGFVIDSRSEGSQSVELEAIAANIRASRTADGR